MCNPGGSAAEGYIGGSGVWMPLKGKLAGVNGVEAGFEVVNVDLTVLKVSLVMKTRLSFRTPGNYTRFVPRTTDSSCCPFATHEFIDDLSTRSAYS